MISSQRSHYGLHLVVCSTDEGRPVTGAGHIVFGLGQAALGRQSPLAPTPRTLQPRLDLRQLWFLRKVASIGTPRDWHQLLG